MRLGYHSITWGGVVGDATGVTNIKDLYYRTNGSMIEAVREIAAAVYAGTEMFDGNLTDYADRPDELRGVLSESGIELVSVYTGANFIYTDVLAEELHRVQRAAQLAAAFGAQRLVVGGGARRAAGTTEEDYDRLAAALDRVTDIAEEHGLEASYHPHLTTIVESPDELERLLPRTRIGYPDTAHLAAGGGDAATLIRCYPDRVRRVHRRDQPVRWRRLRDRHIVRGAAHRADQQRADPRWPGHQPAAGGPRGHHHPGRGPGAKEVSRP